MIGSAGVLFQTPFDFLFCRSCLKIWSLDRDSVTSSGCMMFSGCILRMFLEPIHLSNGINYFRQNQPASFLLNLVTQMCNYDVTNLSLVIYGTGVVGGVIGLFVHVVGVQWQASSLMIGVDRRPTPLQVSN
mmetsp:Transcript_15626/g.23789  ORF Transcript_15626/g.23789 Transcript_15626/m.23789 type:complete len:131 (-) Transcript_15626:66-458(-)